MGIKYLYAESFIDLKVPWKKYSNNTVSIDENAYIQAAFSHFTANETAERVFVTDIQGKENILSDPAIHSDLPELQDCTNQQKSGLIKFCENQHARCN